MDRDTISEMITYHCEFRKDTIRKAKPIVDDDIINVVREVAICNDSGDFPIASNQFAFLDTHKLWVQSSKLFNIHGLDDYASLVTNGVTDAFNDFYYLHNKISVMRGEYTYHRDLGIEVLDDISTIQHDTALIISYPFSATGDPHSAWEDIMRTCEQKRIKVFVDCCLFGISNVADLDVFYDFITHVAFSFSKAFSTGGIRTGVLYIRNNDLTPLRLQNEHMYTQMAGQIIHTELMNSFSPDYIFNKYRDRQLKICETLGVKASDTVIFGTTDDPQFDDFERDMYINRICITYALQQNRKELKGI